MNVNEPIEVDTQHEPTTPLQAALDALERGDGHISPLQAEKLLAYIKQLKRHRDTTDVINHNLAAVNEQQAETILDLSEQLSRHAPANPYEPTRVWDNPTDEVYNE